MMNKKLIAIIIAAVTTFGISARFCRDEYGNRISCSGRVVEGTVDTAGNVAEGTVDVAADTASVLNPFNWGEGGRERREERRQEREARRQERRYRD
jgi:hypothetical protein